MVSLSVGHYGALRYKYNDLKSWEARGPSRSDVVSPAADLRYQIFTPWITRAAAHGSELQPEDRLNSQFSYPMMRRDINKNHDHNIEWETNYYDPLDQRTKSVPSKPKAMAPIPCSPAIHSAVVPSPETLYQTRNPPSKYSTSMSLKAAPYISAPSTRSEEWSTLRQMLPSRGPLIMKKSSENWGTGSDYVPQYASSSAAGPRKIQQPSFPRINSSMSRYAHETHFHDRMFKLF